MTDKLQKLMDQIYKEGVERAKEEAARIVGEAQEEAKRILRAAREEAEEVKQLAHKEAEALKETVASEVRMASRQALALTRQKLTDLVTAKVSSESASRIFDDPEFLKKIVETVIKTWKPQKHGEQDIYVLLPAKEKKALEDYFFAKAKKELEKGIKVQFDEHIKSGFAISPADGSYRIGFTEEDFETLIKFFLRPRLKEFLFENKKKTQK